MGGDLTKNQLEELVGELQEEGGKLERRGRELGKENDRLLGRVEAFDASALTNIQETLNRLDTMVQSVLKSLGKPAPTYAGPALTEGRNVVCGGLYSDGKGGFKNAHGQAVDDEGGLLGDGGDH